jgi:hypothetical protein
MVPPEPALARPDLLSRLNAKAAKHLRRNQGLPIIPAPFSPLGIGTGGIPLPDVRWVIAPPQSAQKHTPSKRIPALTNRGAFNCGLRDRMMLWASANSAGSMIGSSPRQ